MRLTALAVGGFTAVTVLAVGTQSTHAQSQTTENQNSASIVKVQSGNTLSGIAKAHGTTYTRLYDANTHVAHPDKIFPGQDIRIPAAEEQIASRPLPSAATTAPAPQPVAKTAPKATQATPKARVAQPQPKPVAAPAQNVNGGVWDRLAQCESSGNWSINTGNGYYGGLQFTLSSWRAVGGTGYPHQASKAEQIARAEKLKAIQGWGAWPACTAKLGLR